MEKNKIEDYIAEASVVIQTPAKTVWDALMDANASRHYMFGAIVQSSWKEGEPITWSGEWEGKHFEDKGIVLKVEREQLLQYSHFSPLSGKEDVPSNYHTITITLIPEDEGVWVSLTQEKNESREAKEHSEKNWSMMLESLKAYLESDRRG